MMTLRIAAGVAILGTMILNAHHGFSAAGSLPFAILFAALYAALDLAKAAVLVAAVTAWSRGAWSVAVLALALFPALFANSLWNALSQVAVARSQTETAVLAQADDRTRLLDARTRLAADLAAMDASPLYRRTSACADATAADSKAFCARRATALAEFAALSAGLASAPAQPSDPAVDLVAAVIGRPPERIRLAAWLAPVLLAELLGALGFAISASAARPEGVAPPATPSRHPAESPSEFPARQRWLVRDIP